MREPEKEALERNQATEAHFESEELYRYFAESLLDPVYEFDRQGRFLYVNNAFTQMFGYAKKEILANLRILDVIAEEDRAASHGAIDEILRGVTSVRESTFIRKDGARFIGETHSGPLHKKKGEVVGVRGILRDVTERKRAQEELRESEEKYRMLFEHSGFSINIVDPETGKLVVFNRKAHERLGYTREEFQNVTVADADCTMNPLEIKEQFARVLEKGPEFFETKHRTKSGQIMESLVSTVPIRIHGKPFIQTINVDITEHKRAERKLEEQTAQNQLILETAMDGFLVISMEGKILNANLAASTLYGYSQDELIGMEYRDLELEDTPHEIAKHMKTLMKKGSDRFERSHRRKDGRIIDVEISSNYVAMNGQRFFFAFLHDVTARKTAEHALMQREEELEIKAKDLEEANAALRVLLKRRDEDKRELEEKVLFNVRQLIAPCLEKLRKSRLDEKQQTYVCILESNLNEIISPLSYRLSSTHLSLTPAELQTANFVKHGRTTKEIAAFLNLSSGTIETHRKNIRKKIGIRNKKANLRTHLLSIR